MAENSISAHVFPITPRPQKLRVRRLSLLQLLLSPLAAARPPSQPRLPRNGRHRESPQRRAPRALRDGHRARCSARARIPDHRQPGAPRSVLVRVDDVDAVLVQRQRPRRDQQQHCHRYGHCLRRRRPAPGRHVGVCLRKHVRCYCVHVLRCFLDLLRAHLHPRREHRCQLYRRGRRPGAQRRRRLLDRVVHRDIHLPHRIAPVNHSTGRPVLLPRCYVPLPHDWRVHGQRHDPQGRRWLRHPHRIHCVLRRRQRTHHARQQLCYPPQR